MTNQKSIFLLIILLISHKILIIFCIFCTWILTNSMVVLPMFGKYLITEGDGRKQWILMPLNLFYLSTIFLEFSIRFLCYFYFFCCNSVIRNTWRKSIKWPMPKFQLYFSILSYCEIGFKEAGINFTYCGIANRCNTYALWSALKIIFQ